MHRPEPSDGKACATIPNGAPIVVMDGQCALCSRCARLINALDRSGEIRIAPMQSPLGRDLLIRAGLDPTDPASWLFVEGDQKSTSMAAIIRIGRKVGGWGHLAQVLRLVPARMQNRIYAVIARNRHRWFGRASFCDHPSPSLQHRLLK